MEERRVENIIKNGMKKRNFLLFLLKDSCKITTDNGPKVFSEKINQCRCDNPFDGKKNNSTNPKFLQHSLPSGFLLFSRFLYRFIGFHF